MNGYPNWCPTCHVGPHQSCRTRGSRRVTDTHAARIQTQFDDITTAATEESNDD